MYRNQKGRQSLFIFLRSSFATSQYFAFKYSQLQCMVEILFCKLFKGEVNPCPHYTTQVKAKLKERN